MFILLFVVMFLLFTSAFVSKRGFVVKGGKNKMPALKASVYFFMATRDVILEDLLQVVFLAEF